MSFYRWFWLIRLVVIINLVNQLHPNHQVWVWQTLINEILINKTLINNNQAMNLPEQLKTNVVTCLLRLVISLWRWQILLYDGNNEPQTFCFQEVLAKTLSCLQTGCIHIVNGHEFAAKHLLSNKTIYHKLSNSMNSNYKFTHLNVFIFWVNLS